MNPAIAALAEGYVHRGWEDRPYSGEVTFDAEGVYRRHPLRVDDLDRFVYVKWIEAADQDLDRDYFGWRWDDGWEKTAA